MRRIPAGTQACAEPFPPWAACAGQLPAGGLDEPAFYSYAYPSPPGFSEASVEPQEAFLDVTLGEG